MKKVLMSVLVIAMMANCMSGCKQQRQEEVLQIVNKATMALGQSLGFGVKITRGLNLEVH